MNEIAGRMRERAAASMKWNVIADTAQAWWKRLAAAVDTARVWAHWPTPPAQRLRLADSLSLGERRFAFVLILENRRFLIASTPQSVTLLAELSSEARRDIASSHFTEAPSGQLSLEPCRNDEGSMKKPAQDAA